MQQTGRNLYENRGAYSKMQIPENLGVRFLIWSKKSLDFAPKPEFRVAVSESEILTGGESVDGEILLESSRSFGNLFLSSIPEERWSWIFDLLSNLKNTLLISAAIGFSVLKNSLKDHVRAGRVFMNLISFL